MFESIWIHQTLELIVGLWADLSEHQSVKSSSLSRSIRPQPSLLSLGNGLKNSQLFEGRWGRDIYFGRCSFYNIEGEWYDQSSPISAYFGRKGKLLINVGNLFSNIFYILQTTHLTFTSIRKWDFHHISTANTGRAWTWPHRIGTQMPPNFQTGINSMSLEEKCKKQQYKSKYVKRKLRM